MDQPDVIVIRSGRAVFEDSDPAPSQDNRVEIEVAASHEFSVTRGVGMLVLDRGDAVAGSADRMLGEVTVASGELRVFDGVDRHSVALSWPTALGVYSVSVCDDAERRVASIRVAFVSGLVADTA